MTTENRTILAAMATNLDAEALRVKLIAILGRILTVEEIRDAMGLKPSTYYGQVREGRLINLENLKSAAQSLGINEVYLLVECGLLDIDAAEEFAEWMQSGEDRKPLARPKKMSDVRGSLPDAPNL